MPQRNQQKLRPVQWARQDALEALIDASNEAIQGVHDRIDGVLNHFAIYETALVKVIEDLEALSDVLVSAGILTTEPDEVHDEADDELDEDVGPQQDSLEGYAEEPDGPDEPTEETEQQRQTRVAEVRERRRRFAQEEGITAFEEGNETRDQPVDPLVDVTGVPDEGIVVGEGRDPHTGEPVG